MKFFACAPSIRSIVCLTNYLQLITGYLFHRAFSALSVFARVIFVYVVASVVSIEWREGDWLTISIHFMFIYTYIGMTFTCSRFSHEID